MPGAPHGVVSRASLLLQLVAQADADGARVTDLAAASGLPQATVHRILSDLHAEGLLHRTAQHRYVPGPTLYELGLLAPNPVGDLRPYRAILREAAARTSDVVYLSIRRGRNMHYLAREEGAHPVPTFVVDVGEVRRMATCYSGLAMLAALPDSMSRAILHEAGADGRAVMRHVRAQAAYRRQLRAEGYVGGADLVFDGVAGISGLAMPVPSPHRIPLFAVSVSALTPRLPPSRYPEVARILADTVTALEEAYRASLD